MVDVRATGTAGRDMPCAHSSFLTRVLHISHIRTASSRSLSRVRAARALPARASLARRPATAPCRSDLR
eukprot:5295652-Prymnesium_polylepis.1